MTIQNQGLPLTARENGGFQQPATMCDYKPHPNQTLHVVKTSGSKPSFIKRNKTKTNNKNNAEQTTAPLLLGPSHPSRSSKRLSGQKDLRDYQLLLVDMQLAALWSCPMKAGVPLFTVSFLLSHQLFLRDYVSCFHCFASICHSALPLK